MALPPNVLVQVERYLDAALAYLQNYGCFVATSNTKFENFQNEVGQLGQSVKIKLPTRSVAANGLVVTFQGTEQRFDLLATDEARHTARAFNAEQYIYNVVDYMNEFGMADIKELATKVEENIAQVCINNTYRFYGDGVTAINSFGQLALALRYFRNYGAAIADVRGYLDDIAVATIVNSGLTQFVLRRNEEMANSWEIGDFSKCTWYESNLLPLHTAGTVGQNADTLTVVSTNDPSGANITQLTCSGVTVDAGAIKLNDKLQFQDGVSGQPDLRYLTFIGHHPSQNPVQIRATGDADATAGTVTFNIYPALSVTTGPNQNIEHNIVAGMQLKALPSHRSGLIYSGNALFLAMPRLPDESPFTTVTKTDPDTGVSLRHYFGAKFGQNERGYVYDVIWGKKLIDEYAMELVFPL